MSCTEHEANIFDNEEVPVSWEFRFRMKTLLLGKEVSWITLTFCNRWASEKPRRGFKKSIGYERRQARICSGGNLKVFTLTLIGQSKMSAVRMPEHSGHVAGMDHT